MCDLGPRIEASLSAAWELEGLSNIQACVVPGISCREKPEASWQRSDPHKWISSIIALRAWAASTIFYHPAEDWDDLPHIHPVSSAAEVSSWALRNEARPKDLFAGATMKRASRRRRRSVLSLLGIARHRCGIVIDGTSCEASFCPSWAAPDFGICSGRPMRWALSSICQERRR